MANFTEQQRRARMARRQEMLNNIQNAPITNLRQIERALEHIQSIRYSIITEPDDLEAEDEGMAIKNLKAELYLMRLPEMLNFLILRIRELQAAGPKA